MRRFVIVGTRAMSKGKLPINDLAGGAGRMDVLIRALMASILTSHGLRENVEFTMILCGGPGPTRRLKFVSNELKGIHAEERSIAGKIASVLNYPLPPRGHYIERSPGIYDGGGDLEMTVNIMHIYLIQIPMQMVAIITLRSLVVFQKTIVITGVTIAQVVIGVVLMMYFSNLYGTTGVALGSVMAINLGSLILMIYQLYHLRRVLNEKSIHV